MLSFSNRLARVFALAAVVAAAACSDSVTAPSAVSSKVVPTASPAVLALDFVAVDLQYGWLPKPTVTTSTKSDTLIQKFTVDPKLGALISFGADHKVVIYPWTICDPSTSGYGPSYWLQWCTQAQSPITFTFKSWKNSLGRPAMDVKPNVRFVPNSMVRIYFHDASLSSFHNVVIPYCNDRGTCIDEGANDTFQTTYYAPGIPGYWVYRNLRHFSGYNVTAF